MIAPSRIRKAAEEMETPYRTAINLRCHYLAEEAADLLCLGDPVSVALAWQSIDEIIILRETLRKRSIPSSETITDEMVQAARSTPVSELVSFTRGKVACFAHDDKNPSAFYATRTNTLACPVCNKHWDAIGILMDRDGYDFKDAVRQLC